MKAPGVKRSEVKRKRRFQDWEDWEDEHDSYDKIRKGGKGIDVGSRVKTPHLLKPFNAEARRRGDAEEG